MNVFTVSGKSATVRVSPVTPVRSRNSWTPPTAARNRALAPLLRRKPVTVVTALLELEKRTYVEEPREQQQWREEQRYQRKERKELRQVWREIQGRNDWDGLLDPMDDTLRNEIIRYGEFSQACYDSFDFHPYSKYCGSCKYERDQLFQQLGMANCGYEITRFLYATSNINLPGFFQKPRAPRDRLWSPHANWMGFIAVATDPAEIRRLGRRDIVIAWRGTVTALEWIADFMDILRPAQINPLHPHPEIKVELGFLDLYTAREEDCGYCKLSAREQIEAEIKRLTNKYGDENEPLSITVTGHSLGSALAMLSAYDIAEMELNSLPGRAEKVPVTVFSFGGPRVGNAAFKERCEKDLGIKVLRVVNVHDTVPKVPGIVFNEQTPKLVKGIAERLPWHYCHLGVELALDHKRSPFLKETDDVGAFHNLEAYLHLVDGYHGPGSRFYLANGRDTALINKACDFLKDHHEVPPFWWQEANKGLVRNSQGRWVQPERHVRPIGDSFQGQTSPSSRSPSCSPAFCQLAEAANSAAAVAS